MGNEEIARKLEEFQDYLSVSNIFTDIIRWIAWVFVKGLAWIVDMLENLTDDILLIKTFYNNPEIVAFVDTIKPLLYILLAFSLLYTGYLLIFNKKFNREGIAINMFIACIIVLMLDAGMDKANEFTDAAIDAVKVEALYPNDDSTLSGSIIQRNITDLTEIDKNNWSTTDLNVPNSTPPSKIANINVREKYGKDTESISTEGREISKYMLSLDNLGEYRAEKLDQSGLEWNNEHYFRYSINWFTIFVTLGIIAFTLFSIALKLAKLFFELTFNYILALIIAPVDVHDGQKTKKILQAILNTFFATILIFLSMKLYMIGTAYLEDTLSTFPYLIALVAFSLGVIDGPNIVERLFGIDAGLKSGWGVLAGAYAGSKLVSGTGRLAAQSADFMSGGRISNAKDSLAKVGNRNRKGINDTKAPSPNNKENTTNEGNTGAGTAETDINEGIAQGVERKDENTSNVSGTGSISQQAEKQQTQQRKQTKAPSPNDFESPGVVTSPISNPSGQSPIGETTSSSVGSDGSQFAINSNATEATKVTDNATVRNDSDVSQGVQEVQGNTTTNTTRFGGSQSPTNTPPSNVGGTSGSQTTSSSRTTERSNVRSQSIVEQEVAVTNEVQELQSTTSVTASRVTNVNTLDTQSQRKTEKEAPPKKLRPSSYVIPNSVNIQKIRNHSTNNE